MSIFTSFPEEKLKLSMALESWLIKMNCSGEVGPSSVMVDCGAKMEKRWRRERKKINNVLFSHIFRFA